MSAPRFVNTTDGMCWTRREATRDGHELYALAAVEDCPAHLMETYAELEGHGIAGSADVLPVPVGPAPRTLDVVEDELTGVSLSLYEEEQAYIRLRTAMFAVQRDRHNLRARVAELEAELATANGVLEDVAKARRAEVCPCPPEDPPAPHQVGCFFDGVPVSPPSERPVDGLTAAFMPVAALREDEPLKGRARLDASAAAAAEATHWKRLGIEDPHDGPLAHRCRLGHDLPETGAPR